MVSFPAPPDGDTTCEGTHDPREWLCEQCCRKCGRAVENLLLKVAELEDRLGLARLVAGEAEARAEGERAIAEKLREELDREVAEGREALVRSQDELLEAIKRHDGEVLFLRTELERSEATARELDVTSRGFRKVRFAERPAAGEQSSSLQEQSDRLRAELDMLHCELKLRPKPEECERLQTELETVRAQLKARLTPEECDKMRLELLKLRAELKQRPNSEDVAELEAKLQQQGEMIQHFLEIESQMDQLKVELQALQAQDQQAPAILSKTSTDSASARSESIVQGSKWFEERVVAEQKVAVVARDEADRWARELAESQQRELRLHEELRGLREELRLLANITRGRITSAKDFSPTASAVVTHVANHMDQSQVVPVCHNPPLAALAASSPGRRRSPAHPERRVSSRSTERTASAMIPDDKKLQLQVPRFALGMVALSPRGRPVSPPPRSSPLLPSPYPTGGIPQQRTTKGGTGASTYVATQLQLPAEQLVGVIRESSVHSTSSVRSTFATTPRCETPRQAITCSMNGLMPVTGQHGPAAPSRPSCGALLRGRSGRAGLRLR